MDEIFEALTRHGSADLGRAMTDEAAAALAARYDEDALFRSRVVMARHGYGSGEYRYFADPPPEPVASLRAALYARLAPVADEWEAMLGTGRRFPATLDAFRAECRAAGQEKPTPLLLRYREGDHNCLHRDLYGPLVFPIQVVILLSDPAGFAGGRFVTVEQRPRMQSRVEAPDLRRGCALAFAVNERPQQGARGVRRVSMRHGVSRVTAGERMTLGLIFHDAA